MLSMKELREAAIVLAIGCILLTFCLIKQDYEITNLETKINILTNYDEYCLEDSLKQQEVQDE